MEILQEEEEGKNQIPIHYGHFKWDPRPYVNELRGAILWHLWMSTAKSWSYYPYFSSTVLHALINVKVQHTPVMLFIQLLTTLKKNTMQVSENPLV